MLEYYNLNHLVKVKMCYKEINSFYKYFKKTLFRKECYYSCFGSTILGECYSEKELLEENNNLYIENNVVYYKPHIVFYFSDDRNEVKYFIDDKSMNEYFENIKYRVPNLLRIN